VFETDIKSLLRRLESVKKREYSFAIARIPFRLLLHPDNKITASKIIRSFIVNLFSVKKYMTESSYTILNSVIKKRVSYKERVIDCPITIMFIEKMNLTDVLSISYKVYKWKS
jgi:hypothetical protein